MIATLNRGEVLESVKLETYQQANQLLAYAKSLVNRAKQEQLKKQKALIEIRKALMDQEFYSI